MRKLLVDGQPTFYFQIRPNSKEAINKACVDAKNARTPLTDCTSHGCMHADGNGNGNGGDVANGQDRRTTAYRNLVPVRLESQLIEPVE